MIYKQSLSQICQTLAHNLRFEFAFFCVLSIFDFFLKTQGQKKGVNSYNDVVWLLVSTFDGKDKFILDENY